MIFVTNKNDFIHTDRYDGVDYVFEPGEAVVLDEAAAQHMFGFGRPDKTETLVRLGWAMIFDENLKRTVNSPEGVERLKKFVFTKGSFVQTNVQQSSEPEQAILSVDESPI